MRHISARYVDLSNAGLSIPEAARALGVEGTYVRKLSKDWDIDFRPSLAVFNGPLGGIPTSFISAKPLLTIYFKSGIRPAALGRALNIPAHRILFFWKRMGLI